MPSVADLRSRQIELTVAQVRESLASPDLEDYNSILHALAGEDSDRNIALAAIKLVHAERGALLDEREIPDASERFRNDGKKGDRKNYEGKSYDGKAYDGKKSGKFDKAGKFDKGKHGDRAERGAKPQSNGDTEFVYVSLGRKGGVRPGDLVGAIANETGLSGREIGPIRITDNFSVVGVPAGSVDNVVSAMGNTIDARQEGQGPPLLGRSGSSRSSGSGSGPAGPGTSTRRARAVRAGRRAWSSS